MLTASPTLHQLDGKYRVLAQLGQGGTADVFLAVARGPNGFSKLVVLKAMRTNLRYEREFTEMFLNEARLAARLNHPNVVQTNEVFEFEGLPVIVMEYLEGQPLSQVIARATTQKRLPMPLHLHIISEALAGLHYSHGLTDFDGTALQVVHRDMSPHNVFVTFSGQVKVLDFGIAKLANSQVETATGIIKGKLRYMPPEQLSGEPVNLRADLFSVGVMLWEAATSEKMWAGMSELAVMKAISNGTIPAVRASSPDIAPELEAIIDRALSPNPADRFASARDLKHALDAYLRGLGPAIGDEDIEILLEDLFGEEHAQTRALIEQQMTRVSTLSPTELLAFSPLELMHSATPAGMTASRLNRFSSPGNGPSRKHLLAGGAALVLMAAVSFSWLRANRPAPALEPIKAPVIATQPVPPIETARIELRVTAFPGSSELYLDGKLLPKNPYAASFVADPSTLHELSASAPGFEAEKRSLVFDQSRDLVLRLVASKPPSAKARPTTTPPAANPPASPACDPPFTVDQRGVKKFKPECLK